MIKKPVILCVDDEKIVIDSLKEQLKRSIGQEYLIETAESADEAIGLVDQIWDDKRDFPVVICDQIMPGMKGDELLTHIHNQFPKTLKILLTGQADVEAVGRAVNNAGLYRYIRKPWDREDIVLTVSEAIKAHFQELKIERQNQELREMNVIIERKLAEILSEQTVILENAIVGILFSKDGKVVRVNRRIEDLFKVTRNDVTGQDVRIFFPEEEDFIQFNSKALPLLGTASGHFAEQLLRRSDGTTFWCGIYGRAIQLDAVDEGTIWVIEDLTQRKEAEDQLKSAKERAENATKLKDKFVSLVSHDLRSPLSSSISLLRYLQGEIGPIIDEAHRRALHSSIDATEGLIQMIDRLLSLSRLNTGRLRPDFRVLNLNGLAGMAAEKHEFLARGKGVAIAVDIPGHCTALGDPTLINEVLGNLVSNAIKFCRSGDRITISLENEHPPVLMVQDTGVGIKEAMLENLFRQEVKTTTVGTGGERGTGMGLPLCKEIMIAHGGDLTVRSRQGEGSSFYVTFPETRPTVFIVDDQDVMRDLLREHLAAMPVHLIEAEDGFTALEKLDSRHPPCLVITDLNMPGIDGFNYVQRLRSMECTRNVPVVMISSDYSEENCAAARQLGIKHFLRKPLVRDEFLAAVGPLIPRA